MSSNEAGQRLDLWLQSRLAGVSRKQVKALLDAGRVVINGRRVVIAGWELCAGDEVDVRALRERPGEAMAQGPEAQPERARRPEMRPQAKSRAAGVSASIDRHFARRKARKKGREHRPKKEPVSVKVYHQDRDLIVVEKPGGLLSVPNDKADARESMIDRVRSFLRRKYRDGKASFVSPLHRLDAETSGVMVFALSRDGQRLTGQFKEHSIQRTYLAIVEGRIERENGVIDRPLEKGEFGEGKKAREAEGPGGRRAVTEYRVKERYKDATLVELSVRTGRTHQIRVHLAAEGFPVLGDALYAKELAEKRPELMDEVDRTLGFRRHALHAAYLGFKHPSGGRKMTFRSPMPDDMKA
ncbi:MAG: RluA family pseudouridine synthase, partial [Proteobacteria bacterium]|nr:RluA family pseudouridine synthase [Pseudomonadota bacterium]